MIDDMEVNENEFSENDSSDSFGMDNVGHVDDMEMLESSELEEGIDTKESISDDGSGDNDSMSIDYVKLTASVREAQTVNTIDSDLNDLPLSDVLMLVLALVLGVVIVRMRR